MRSLLSRLFAPQSPWARGLLVGLFMLAIWQVGALQGLERWGLNQLFSLRGPILSETSIIIVAIAEPSFDELDLPWPWPRALHGDLLARISEGKPLVIGLDMVFPEPSLHGEQDDRDFADAIGQAGHVVLAAALTTSREALYVKEDLNAPIKRLRERAVGWGLTNYMAEDDAFVRSAETTRHFQGKDFPTFPYRLYQTLANTGFPVSSPPQGSFLINYRGVPGSFPMVPYHQVINGEVDPSIFEHKIVLVGATTPILHDIFPTPVASSGDMPGVEIQANVLETLIKGTALDRLPQSVMIICTLVAGILGVWVTARFRPLISMSLLLGLTVAFLFSTYLAFAYSRLVVDLTVIPNTLLLGYGSTLIESFIREQRQRSELMHIFSKHVSPEVAEAIWQQREEFLRGGRLRAQKLMATIYFTDLKGFSGIAEAMQHDTEALLSWINKYMDVMAGLVMAHGGVVDDYFGDAIKANFGVPFPRTPEQVAQDAQHAVECALAMGDELKRLNREWLAQGLPSVGMRVGICTGEIVAGCVGSAERLKFTTIGDIVNTAARLEQYDKQVATPDADQNPIRILIAESTKGYLNDRFVTEAVGELELRNMTKKMMVYRVLRKQEVTRAPAPGEPIPQTLSV